ncbi:MAG: metallophosphoesterase [Bacillota bacterium]
MRFLVVADSHLRGTSPQGRRDDFFATCRAKLEEVVELTESLQVDALLHLGDLFDRPDLAPGVVREFVLVLRRCRVPIYGIVGNHDVYGHNPESLPRTLLGLVEALGGIRLIGRGEVVWLGGGGRPVVQLTGAPFRYDIDSGDGEDYVVKKDARADVAIHMAHGMLLEKPWVPGLDYVLIDRVAPQTEADLTLVGHYHLGYSRLPLEPVPGRLFVNPGAMVRLEATLPEVARRPQVVLVEVDGGGIAVRGIPLRSAPPGDEVLDRSLIEAAAYREAQLADFIQRVREAWDGRHLYNVEDMVAAIASGQGYPEEVKVEALRRVGMARERLAGGGGWEQ